MKKRAKKKDVKIISVKPSQLSEVTGGGRGSVQCAADCAAHCAAECAVKCAAD